MLLIPGAPTIAHSTGKFVAGAPVGSAKKRIPKSAESTASSSYHHDAQIPPWTPPCHHGSPSGESEIPNTKVDTPASGSPLASVCAGSEVDEPAKAEALAKAKEDGKAKDALFWKIRRHGVLKKETCSKAALDLWKIHEGRGKLGRLMLANSMDFANAEIELKRTSKTKFGRRKEGSGLQVLEHWDEDAKGTPGNQAAASSGSFKLFGASFGQVIFRKGLNAAR
eukprot:s240_g3.t1